MKAAQVLQHVGLTQKAAEWWECYDQFYSLQTYWASKTELEFLNMSLETVAVAFAVPWANLKMNW